MRMVSVLGDSISTYEGYNPRGYAVYYDREKQYKNGMNSVYDTWWAKVNQRLRAYLCVNNSYSGSRVTGTGFPAACCEDRLAYLRTDTYSPDIILIYMGFNDFGNGVKIKRKNAYAKDFLSFAYAYDFVITRLKELYPDSEIVCGTLMRSVLYRNREWIFPERHAGVSLEDYNDTIRRICNKRKCFVADLAASGLRYETLDGSHPTAEGHKTLADAWTECLAELGFISVANEPSSHADMDN